VDQERDSETYRKTSELQSPLSSFETRVRRNCAVLAFQGIPDCFNLLCCIILHRFYEVSPEEDYVVA
jgi:hypothetical protein